MEKKYIFVAGPSESGKSGAVNYLKDNNLDIKHLKIRNVFPEVYKDSSSTLEYDEWYNYESLNNFENFWNNYIKKANQMSLGYPIVIMDTMYGLNEIKYLYNLLKDNLVVLYIDADIEKRVQREYLRLRTDSTHSKRKADLSITIEDVIERTNKKDEKKKRLQTFEYKNLRYTDKGIDYCFSGDLFSYIIENNGTIEQLQQNLDIFIQKVKGIEEKEKILTKGY